MSPLQALAPDQRAILELLLRQGRSYGELSELLGLPEEGVRTRAHSALAALAPDRPAPVGEDGAVGDWLLGQQSESEAARTRDSVAAIPAWRVWATEVAARLGEVDGAAVPAIRDGEEPAPTPKGGPQAASERGGRPRPLKATGPAAAPPAAPPPAAGGLRSSRLGGAVLIGILVVLVGAVLFFLFGRGGDDKTTAASTGKASSTATPTATPQVVTQVVLKGVGDSAQGLMQVVKRESDGKLVFVLAAEKVPPNRAKEVYAVWFTKQGIPPRNLGFAQAQVGKDGRFATGGPQQGQENDFARWLTQYGQVVVARASAASGAARQPGQVVLRGTLPGGQ